MTDYIRKTIVVQPEQYERIKDFRFENRMTTEMDAIRTLIEMGMHFAILKDDEQFNIDEQAAVERLNKTIR